MLALLRTLSLAESVRAVHCGNMFGNPLIVSRFILSYILLNKAFQWQFFAVDIVEHIHNEQRHIGCSGDR